MRYLTIGVVVWCLAIAGAPANAQTPDPQMMAPIQKFLDSFNKGDVAGAASTHAADAGLVIIDEAPPYVWRGAKAVEAWAADLASEDKKRGITDQAVAIAAPTRVETNGDQAYVIVPAVYTFKQGGVAMRASAQMTFVVKKGAGGWLIHGWTWTGPKAKPVA
jgi:ketosteroid isomerase-like protein